MAGRLGNVIYWACSIVAGLWLAYAVVGITNGFEHYPTDSKLYFPSASRSRTVQDEAA